MKKIKNPRSFVGQLLLSKRLALGQPCLNHFCIQKNLFYGTLLEIENGNRFPSMKMVYRLSIAYEIPFGEFVDVLINDKRGRSLVFGSIGNKENVFGNFLRESRWKLGITIVELAKKNKVSATLLCKWESGYFFPRENRLDMIAKIYKINRASLGKCWFSSKTK